MEMELCAEYSSTSLVYPAPGTTEYVCTTGQVRRALKGFFLFRALACGGLDMGLLAGSTQNRNAVVYFGVPGHGYIGSFLTSLWELNSTQAPGIFKLPSLQTTG